MSQVYDLQLSGCAPEPLMAYLKALGIFRLLSEQGDPQARAWWELDTFFVRSSLDRGGADPLLPGRIPSHAHRVAVERR